MEKSTKVLRGNTRARLSAARRAFRSWRRTRPFWGGVFTLVAALLLLYPPYASLEFGDIQIALRTTAGITGLVIGMVLIAAGASFWFRPEWRLPAGVVTLVLSVVAIVTVNLGSLLTGTLSGLIGGALAIAWSPRQRPGKHGTDRTGASGRAQERPKPSPVPRERPNHSRQEVPTGEAVGTEGGEA
ncbi:DUF6114 domain-containing protein [Actinopolyspora mortivallis]|uniref:Integral membrane protein n=1 Tax=Actinopolyspora mortivallis TaxID=33906 RepID=A0A2T0GZI8_ACTMO|nr:DUF6114 domain-containing protein [Actinopolyspora mortivallis]PRW64500.1 hypothetical protein CEP50_03830 [Actinopolyspora mortivallis]